MAEPDLAAAFQKPKVMQAILEAQQDPMAMLKYQDDPDVKMVRTVLNGQNPRAVSQRCKQTLLVVDRSLLLLQNLLQVLQALLLHPCMYVFQRAKLEPPVL